MVNHAPNTSLEMVAILYCVKGQICRKGNNGMTLLGKTSDVGISS